MKSFQATLLLIVMACSVYAGVVQETVNSYSFKGALGVAMRLMSDMDKPTKSVDYYAENIRRSDTFNKDGELTSSSIFDAEKGAIISIDHIKKTYTEITLKQMEEMINANLDAIEGTDEDVDVEEETETNVEVSYKVDVDMVGKESMNGFDAAKYMVKITVEATATNEENGASQTSQPMIINSEVWAVKDLKAAKEIDKYNRQMAETAMEEWADSKEFASAITTTNPQLGSAMQAYAEELQKIEGTVVKNTVSYAVVKKEAEPEAKEEKQAIPTSVGGLLGGISKKVAKKIEKSMSSDVLMESSSETTKLEITDLPASTFQVPAGYERQELDMQY